MNAVEIGYALAKQVPAMRQEVRLYTDCGELLLQGAAAERVARVVERVLYARLRQLEREARRGRRTRCEEPRARYGSGDPIRIDRRAACGRALGGPGWMTADPYAESGPLAGQMDPFIHPRPGGLE